MTRLKLLSHLPWANGSESQTIFHRWLSLSIIMCVCVCECADSAPHHSLRFIVFYCSFVRVVLHIPSRNIKVTTTHGAASGEHFVNIFVKTIWSRNCDCLVTWFCYQLIAKPGNKTATVPWPDPYFRQCCWNMVARSPNATHESKAPLMVRLATNEL